MRLARRLPVLIALAAAACVATGNAAAETVLKRDGKGRAMHFDVQAAGVDVNWYATLLRNAAHGDEISTVTIRIVPVEEIHDACGAAAAGCYSDRRSATLVVPAGRSRLIASVLLHEYGHHLDAAWRVAGVSEPNGTPVWWALRAMSEFRGTGAVTDSYRLGWDRGVGEIFAEDYAYIHLGDSYGIPWLYPPTTKLKKALLAELRGESTTVPPTASLAGMTRPVLINDSGYLDPGASHAETFRLLGPGRRITLTASVSGANGRALVTCNGSVVKSTPLVSGRSATLDLPRVGPADCRATVTNTGAVTQRFALRLRLALQS